MLTFSIISSIFLLMIVFAVIILVYAYS
jgi:hypothetical protein